MRFIIGCDFHPGYQYIAMLDTETGKLVKKRLVHEGEEVLRRAASTGAGGHRNERAFAVVREG